MVTYRFGAHTLDTRTLELLRDGKAMPVEPQVFSLLKYLIENRDRVVSKEELISAVWNGRIVSDMTLGSRISAARRAVCDTGKDQATIRTLPRRGFRFIADLQCAGDTDESRKGQTDTDANSDANAPAAASTSLPPRQTGHQRIQFCVSTDGTRLAFATTGRGYPLVRTGHWLTHIEFDLGSAVWGPFLAELGSRFQLTRYDQRGNGLSDWDVTDFGLDRLVEDLEAVVEAAGLEEFALYSLGAPIAIAYAVRHPKRVSHLILHNGYVLGRSLREAAEEREQGEALLTLIRHGWGKPGSPFVKALASMYIPGGSTEQIESLAHLQRQSTTSDNAVRFRAAIDHFDFTGLLGRIAAPTLVIHARDDYVQPLDEGRKLSAGIRNSEFVLLDSASHALVQGERAWDVFFDAVTNFVRC